MHICPTLCLCTKTEYFNSKSLLFYSVILHIKHIMFSNSNISFTVARLLVLILFQNNDIQII